MSQEGVILIVDDEPSARDTLEAFLFPEGYTLVFARNGTEALQAAAQVTPDLVLLDVMMPDMNGFEVCRRLRADPQLNAVHIVMVTALDDRDSRLRGLEAGADEFLSKPFDSAELLVRARTVMQLNRYRRLLAEQMRFSWVVEQAQDGYVMLDAGGNVQYTNPQARRFLGMTETLTATQPAFMTWVAQHYRLEPAAAWQDWPAAAVERRHMVRPESAMAPALWLRVSLVKMAAADQVQFLVQLRDVTEEIMARNRGWAFDTHIGHKIKTPLGQLTGTLQLLDFDFETLSREEIRDEVTEACESAQRLKERIMSIFQYMDVLDARQTWHELCRLPDLAGLVGEIQAELELETLSLTRQGAQEPPAALALPRPTVKLILGELCKNAQKFHPTHTPTVAVTLTALAEGLQVCVADDGLSLPYDELDKIWRPYYQVEKTVTGEVPGMGLGLAVVASLIANVGGTYRAYNCEGRSGLTVELWIPFEREVS